jgi:general secretion pathway protein K
MPKAETSAMRHQRSTQCGLALVLVLWVLALLTIIAVGLTVTQRTESTLAANQIATTRFRALAEAGIDWAMLNVLAPQTGFEDEVEAWVPDGTPRHWTFAGEKLEIRVFNEASRIDLNNASVDLLKALFAAVQIPQDEASALADAIQDWRDTDDLKSLNGAEDDDYAAAGRSYGAKDDPFDSVEELQLVLGVSQELYRVVAPALTVSSGQAKVDSELASTLVSAALQGITVEEAELQQEEREAVADGSGARSAVTSRGGPLYRIRVTQLVEEEPTQSMEALVRTDAGASLPFSVLWRRFAAASEDFPVAAAHGDKDHARF